MKCATELCADIKNNQDQMDPFELGKGENGECLQ
jgi:hypothetical protein